MESSTDAKSHYYGVFEGRSQLILGSEDERAIAGFSYGYGHRDRRMSHRRLHAQQVGEFYADWSHSQGTNGDPANTVYAFGALAYAHFQDRRFYADLGIGLQLQNRATTDLPSDINSTPMAGFGYVCKAGRRDLLAGLRLLHVSNARTRVKNPGQNQLFLMLTLRL